MRRIEHLLIIAGPSACGKTTLIREILAGRLPELHTRVGVEDLPEWPSVSMHQTTGLSGLGLKHLILHYDFLWPSYHGSDGETPRVQSASRILQDAREASFITLWTPPARLERQFIKGKLCAPIPPNWGGVLRAALFRFLPRFVIRGLSKFPLLEQMDRWLPGSALIRGLLIVRIYSQPDQVVALYRRWFEFCDRQISKTRDHVVVEFDRELKFYSRDDWENRIRNYES